MDNRKAVTAMRCAILLACCLLLQAAERDPDEVIKQVTEKVTTTVGRIPNYSCVENVTREYYRPKVSSPRRTCPVLMEQRQHPTPKQSLQLAKTDRLRLDVTMTGTGEIFSWIGASRFSDAPINHLVDGPIVTGSFGGFLSIVFKQDVQKFTFEGTQEEDGRSLMAYAFQVAAEHSGYIVKVPGEWVKSGYSGTALVDPRTDDLVRLTVNTSVLPAATGACEISTHLDLNMVKIGDGEFLLPAEARQRYVITNGEETESTTAFSECREYRGESSVSFTGSESGVPGSGQNAMAASIRVPAKQKFTFELTAPIASATAAAGDAFSGRLLTPLRDQRGKTLAPAGNRVEGRLLRVERDHIAPAATIVVLKLESVDVGDSKLPLTAVRDSSRDLAGAGRGKAHLEIALPLPSERHAGVFRFPGDQAVVPRGYKSDWRTVDAESR